MPASEPQRWSGSGAAQLTDGDVFAIPVMGPISRLVSGVMDRPTAGYSIATDAHATFTIERGIVRSDDFVALTPGFVLRASGSIDSVEDVLDIDAEMNARGPLRLVGWPLSKLLKYKGEGSLSDPQWRAVNFTLPRNRRLGQEEGPLGPRLTQKVPKVVGAGTKGAVDLGSKALTTGAKVTRGVGARALGTSARLIGGSTKGAMELGSRARDLLPFRRILPPLDGENTTEEKPPAEPDPSVPDTDS